MEKKTAIELAQSFAEFNPADKYFVTTDDKVFTDANAAVSNAMSLSAGNPQVMEVLASEFETAPEGDKAPESELEAAKSVLKKAEDDLAEKQKQYDDAEPSKRGFAKTALNRMLGVVETAKAVVAQLETGSTEN